MRKETILIAFSIFIFSFSRGQILSDVVVQVNEATKQAGQNQQLCPGCDEKTLELFNSVFFEGDKVQKCIESICPDIEGSGAKAINEALTEDKSVVQRFHSEIVPLIEKYQRIRLEDEIEYSRDLLSWLDRAGIESDPAVIRLVNFSILLNDIDKLRLKIDIRGAVVLDLEKSKASLPGLSDDEIYKRAAVLSEYLKINESFPIEGETSDELHLYHPGGELEKKVRQVHAENQKRHAALLKDKDMKILMATPDFRDLVDESLVGRIVSSEKVNATELGELREVYVLLRLLEKISRDRQFKKIVNGESLDIKALAQKSNLEGRLKERLENYNKLLVKLDTQVVDVCLAHYNFAQKILPKKVEIERFKQNLPRYREWFKTYISKKMSSQSARKVLPEIDKVQFSLPLTPDLHHQQMQQALQLLVAGAQKSKDANKKVRESEMRDKIYGLMAAIESLGGKSGDENELSNSKLVEVCEVLSPNVYFDASLTVKNSVGVSALSVRNPLYGEGIIYHELSHILWQNFENNKLSSSTRKWQKETVQCLVSQHAVTLNNSSNEDWADYIAVHTLLDHNVQAPNPECLFVRQVDPEEYKGLSIFNLNPFDSHSSPLYRALSAAYQMNRFTPQCEALFTDKIKSPFKKCSP